MDTMVRRGFYIIKRVFLIVLDGAGVGALPDAEKYGDRGSNTLGNVAQIRGKLHIPNLLSLGLNRIIPLKGTEKIEIPLGAYGKMAELSPGKDTVTGHWELSGLTLTKPFPVYPEGFPGEVIQSFEKIIGRKSLGNFAASGTEVIKMLGEEHLRTGYPIVYTSADSVFQIAAHTDIISLETLYEWCQRAREEIFVGKHALGRVIARPFSGVAGEFYRLKDRKDFSLAPPDQTLLDIAKEEGFEVWVIGKVRDIFAGRGMTRHIPGSDNENITEAILGSLKESFEGIVWANLIDFDMIYGHRNDVEGFARALEEFDISLGKALKLLKNDDMLVITADHGCDPTFDSTDHTREYVPVIVYGHKINPVDLGTRESFADLGATIAEVLGCRPTRYGKSFAMELLQEEKANI